MNDRRELPLGGEPSVVVLGSGKGGVGKSVTTVLLGAALAAEGQRVLLFDADQNLGNLHVLLGVRPNARREAVLHGEHAPADLVQKVGNRLYVLPADSAPDSLDTLAPIERARLDMKLTELYDRFDVVLVDAGAGIESVVQATRLRATRLTVVTTPEPTALTDAYALIKVMNVRNPTLPIDVLVNQTIDAAEGHDTFAKLAAACERFLRRGVRYLGAIPEDTEVRRAVRDPQRLLATLAPSAAAATVRDTVLSRLDLPTMARSAV